MGGLGGWIQASLSVTAGQKLYIFVGGDALVGARFNGGGAGCGSMGGGGGGATDIRTTSDDLTSRLIVAGGGGELHSAGGSGGTKMCLRLSYFISITPTSAKLAETPMDRFLR